MDVRRENSSGKRWRVKALLGLVMLLGVAAATAGISHLKGAAPRVEKSSVWLDQVRRGSMLREVRGTGTLVPEEIRWIPASVEGIVERVLVQPGSEVKADTVLAELSNPELQQQLLDAKWQLDSAQANLTAERVRIHNQILEMQSAAAKAESEYSQAKLALDTDEQLFADGLLAERNLKLSRIRTDQARAFREIENQRLERSRESVDAQLAVHQAQVEQAKGVVDLKARQIRSLQVTAGIDGVLQQLPVEVGQRVTTGMVLAKVINPQKLKAVLRVAETQARDLTTGQRASVDTRNGLIQGRVCRIDPAAQDGTVTVDIALEGSLPRGARPDLSIDGVIEIERLADVLYVGRPAGAQSESETKLFKLMGDRAVRVPVRFGRGSASSIEVIQGLNEGDRVILSDMSSWDAVDAVELK